ncbi:MAG TPA: PilZ domain-containing protein [Planctomycetota bacterium]|nr:PilZ domain-containing protein [Planctomycetota bacterium]
MADRRLDDRVPDEIPALLAREPGDPEVQAAMVRNLSDGGACAAAHVAPMVGSEIYVGFFLEGFGGVPIIAKARVAWTKPSGGGHLVGLSYRGESPAQREAVAKMRAYLASRRRELLALPTA